MQRIRSLAQEKKANSRHTQPIIDKRTSSLYFGSKEPQKDMDKNIRTLSNTYTC